MRTRLIWLTIVTLVGLMGLSTGRAQEAKNLLVNGGFEDGRFEPWSTLDWVMKEVVTSLEGATIPEPPVEGAYCLHVQVPRKGTTFYEAGLVQKGTYVFRKGKQYTLSAFFKCKKGTLQVNLKPESAQAPYQGYGNRTVTMTEKWTEFSTTTPVFAQDVSPAEVVIHIAYDIGDFWMDGVRLYEGAYVPPALDPRPKDGAKNVPQNVVLRWTPGVDTLRYDVYFGDSLDDVVAATRAKPLGALVSADQTGSTYELPMSLQLEHTYYWRIDTVTGTGRFGFIVGPVWSFTTTKFLIVDDFESYTDNLAAGGAVFQTWRDRYNPDGSADPANGAVVGNEQAPFAERTYVNGGKQAMPLFYDNTSAAHSEATRTWAKPQDWTVGQSGALRLCVYGNETNKAGRLYVTLEDSRGNKRTYNCPDPSALTRAFWNDRTIPLEQFVGLNMAAVKKMVIGVGNLSGGARAVGRVYIDDIQIRRMPLGLVEGFEGGFGALNWTFDGGPPWRISSSVSRVDSRSAQAGEIGDEQQTSLSITLNCQTGEIRFWRKTSCESMLDFLEFFIDGQPKGQWSGELNWQEVVFPVQAGKRVFTWTYTKDSSESAGEDTAWIDEIAFPTQ